MLVLDLFLNWPLCLTLKIFDFWDRRHYLYEGKQTHL